MTANFFELPSDTKMNKIKLIKIYAIQYDYRTKLAGERSVRN